MKILFGGTFDPVHNGHVALALHVAKEFQHQVSFLPLNGTPNYKPAPIANLEERIAMLKLIVNQHQQQLDIDYSETLFNTYSPTYVTLSRLRQKYGTNEPFYFIIGGDSLISLDSWDHWQELFAMTNFIVAARPGYSFDSMNDSLLTLIQDKITTAKQFNQELASGQIIVTDFNPIEVSSTLIRSNCHHKLNITNMVAPAVKSYLKKYKLYQ